MIWGPKTVPFLVEEVFFEDHETIYSVMMKLKLPSLTSSTFSPQKYLQQKVNLFDWSLPRIVFFLSLISPPELPSEVCPQLLLGKIHLSWKDVFPPLLMSCAMKDPGIQDDLYQVLLKSALLQNEYYLEKIFQSKRPDWKLDLVQHRISNTPIHPDLLQSMLDSKMWSQQDMKKEIIQKSLQCIENTWQLMQLMEEKGDPIRFLEMDPFDLVQNTIHQTRKIDMLHPQFTKYLTQHWHFSVDEIQSLILKFRRTRHWFFKWFHTLYFQCQTSPQPWMGLSGSFLLTCLRRLKTRYCSNAKPPVVRRYPIEDLQWLVKNAEATNEENLFLQTVRSLLECDMDPDMQEVLSNAFNKRSSSQ